MYCFFSVVSKDVMETGCDGCSEKLGKLLRKTLKIFQTSFPNEWNTFLEKYDPTGKNRINIISFSNKE